MNSLSVKITNLMMINGIANESQLARCVGIYQPTLSRLLAGKIYKPNQRIIRKIAEFFDVSVDHLLVDSPLQSVYISEAERYHGSPSSVLRYLMQDIGNMSEGELSRRTGVPQPTIHRILSGMTPNPRIESIEPLAEFFNISPDQMLGRIPLPKDRISGSFAVTTATKKIVPLLNWMEIAYWPEIIKDPNFKTERNWITSESGIKGSAFALKISNVDYLPEFRKGTVIIIDYTRMPKEGDFVLALLTNKNQIVVGQLSREKKQDTLMPLSQGIKELTINERVKLCGVIAEAKHNF
ncbi:MAG: hypothetical protein A3F42_07390 [Gammaproteobacteria bacterium RIFCSPHIGHO2_12_FULL_37_34]|nr:MAG: hypothetical protein A3F42_07390 [Gammaproteobacteria bacterium RIFCSPHIGHO2_12_FULL_37_34]